MTTLVLGATGFIGRHLVKRLHADGEAVRGFSRNLPSDPILSQTVDWVAGSLSDQSSLTRAFADVETCYHLVSTTVPRTSNADPVFDIETNLCASIKVLEAAAKSGVKRFVFLSSGGTVYGPPQHSPMRESHPLLPISSYGIVKAAIERYIDLYFRQTGLNYAIVRLSNPFGPGQLPDRAQGAVAVFMHRIMTAQPITIWGDGSAVRDYLFIDDAIEGITSVARHAGAHRVFNVGSGVGTSLREIIGQIETAVGRQAKVEYVDQPNFDVSSNILSIAHARNQLGFEPKFGLGAALNLTHDWMSTRSNLIK